MGNTADLAMVQKTIIVTLHKEEKSQRLITERGAVQGVLYQSILNAKLTGRKKLDRKMCTSNSDDRKLENTVIYQDILEHFMLPSADKLYGDADFIFQQDLGPAHTAKVTKSWFNDHGVTVLDCPANSPDLNPIENRWSIVKRKMRDIRPNNADDLKAAIKATWASVTADYLITSITPEQSHRLIVSMPRRIDAVIHAKGGPTKY